jgi:F-type H+-transporting ATPase subunit gamma
VATLRDIQRRIKAVSNTQQITKAMKMVAASKLRKSQSRMLELRPYADKMNAVIKSLCAGCQVELHPLLGDRPRTKVEVLVITSDRGLCGAFNTNVMKGSVQLIEDLEGESPDNAISSDHLQILNSSVGKKARDYYKHRGVELTSKWVNLSGNITFEDAQEITAALTQRYIDGDVDEVYVVYNEFVNVVTQKVQAVKLLPISTEMVQEEQSTEQALFIFEPSEEELLDTLLPKNVEIQVYRALLESQASEEAARMTSMENATKAASDMIEGLTLKYNKARQASITAELMDIVGGVEALKD